MYTLRGRLNISRNSPKKITFGNIIDDASLINEDLEYTFCVFKAFVGKSYCYKKRADEDFNSIPLKDGYDSVYIDSTEDSYQQK